MDKISTRQITVTSKGDGGHMRPTSQEYLDPQQQESKSSVNYNSSRGNGSDSDGAGAVAVEVLREAEALMRKHANHPEFLLQLFRHASQITVNTDQHVAVALLQDLATQPHGSNHGMNSSNRGINNENSNFSLPAPLRDSSWRSHSTSQADRHNILPQENISAAGLSGSEVSDSGLTSEDEDSRALYRNVKNLSLSPGGRPGATGAIPRTTPDINTSHPRPPAPQPHRYHQGGVVSQPHLQYPPQASHHNYPYFQQQHNLSSNRESSRGTAHSESTLYDHLPYSDSQMSSSHPQEVEEEWLRHALESEEVEQKSQKPLDTAGSSPEHPHHAIHTLSNDTEYLTFETLVSSAVKASVEVLQSHVGGAMTPGGSVSPLLLTTLHHTLIAQIQNQAQSLQLPQSFLFSVYNELKEALQVFSGKQLREVSNEVPSVISQVLLTQYCSVLVQRLRDNHPVLPETPTKLPQNKQKNETASETTTPVNASRHSQENTTATQTEPNVFSLTSHQHTVLTHTSDTAHGASHYAPPHTFSMSLATGGISSNKQHSLVSSSQPVATTTASLPGHSSLPHPPQITASHFQPSSASGSGQWQLPMANASPGGASSTLEAASESHASAMPTSQPESWAASSSKPHLAEASSSVSQQDTASSSSASQMNSSQQEWAEPEHEEAVMDDLSEPVLPVHDLAEADQSQDAGDAAEGDWEDSQAEGIQADSASGTADSSPEQPIRLQPREKASQQQAEAEGMTECEADEAEGTVIGAVAHMGYSAHHGQGATRELGLDEVPTKLQSPDGGSPSGSPEHHASGAQGGHTTAHQSLLHTTPPQSQNSHPKSSSHAMQPPHSPGGSEG
ncbi:uncharacterized protein LOC119581992 isoform X4 [Penaeus monodon]|uniref:uncharacterized protein LOC119581992 isoform X4 n=1 Tax=Penaeus monodon TaxID=6687 RepID=UPI0018A7239F|nr:uncharacterized protein LOC119581992 isoform X4 [Penaeus monodon]